MQRFAELYRSIDETTKTNEKLAAMVRYFQAAPPEDAAWAVHFLSGNRLKRLIPVSVLREWAIQSTHIPSWLFEESYQWVGDLAETLSLAVPSDALETTGSLAEWVETRLLPLGKQEPIEAVRSLDAIWKSVGPQERFVLMKLVTGSMRVGVSRRLVIRAIADAFERPVETIAHRLMGHWLPTRECYQSLISESEFDAQASQPYPFCLANPIEGAPESIGDCVDFLAEWKWDGIRAQLIRRQGQSFLWSRGEERLEDRFPEVMTASLSLPSGLVLDGELLAWQSDAPLPFAQMQRRIGRKTVGKKLLQEVPVVFMAFDLLEWEGQDMRSRPLQERRHLLEKVLAQPVLPGMQSPASIRSSPVVVASDWETLSKQRDNSRSMASEGLMLKRKDSLYEIGRVRGNWWKWKVEPYSIDAVLIYAQQGHGRRANLYTDYTFALWEGDQLVPFAKAYSGLTDEEIRRVDRFIKENTKEKFGPVRSVTPELVMEIAFENIQLSTRHKSGVAVRFPRIARWRHDKKPVDANKLSDLIALIPS